MCSLRFKFSFLKIWPTNVILVGTIINEFMLFANFANLYLLTIEGKFSCFVLYREVVLFQRFKTTIFSRYYKHM